MTPDDLSVQLLKTFQENQNRLQIAQLALIGSLAATFVSLMVSIVTIIYGRKTQTQIENQKATLSKDVENFKSEIQRNLEALKHKLDLEKDEFRSRLMYQKSEIDARRDYEYEARKRLYTDFEPFLFQLCEAAERFQSRVISLARSARDGSIRPDGSGWLDHDGYYLRSTIYELIVPLCIFRIMRRSLTLLDLTVDSKIEKFFTLAKSICFSMTDDHVMANLGNFSYQPNVDNWKDKRIENPASFWRQGVPLGRLDIALDSFLSKSEGGRYEIISFGDFEMAYLRDSPKRVDWDSLRDVFIGFHPASRPILWCILNAQARMCSALLTLRARPTTTDSVEFAELLAVNNVASFDWLAPGDGSEEHMLSLREQMRLTTEAYLAQKFAPRAASS